MKVKSESEVAQSCLTVCGPMDCSLPASSTHGILQARVLEWGAISFSIPTFILIHSGISPSLMFLAQVFLYPILSGELFPSVFLFFNFLHFPQFSQVFCWELRGCLRDCKPNAILSQMLNWPLSGKIQPVLQQLLTKKLLKPILGFVQGSLLSEKMLYEGFLKKKNKEKKKKKCPLCLKLRSLEPLCNPLLQKKKGRWEDQQTKRKM